MHNDWAEKGAQKLPYHALHDGQRGVAVRLPRHDHVAAHRGRRATDKEKSDEQPGIHEPFVCGAERHDAECGGAADEVALELYKEVQFPAHVVLDEQAGGQCAAVDEEDDGYGEVGYRCAFDLLL